MPTTTLLTYADGHQYKRLQRQASSSVVPGDFDIIRSLDKTSIPSQFIRDNARIFQFQRGAGLWVWKPKIIYDTLESLNEGDYLFYIDTANKFAQSLQTYKDLGEDILLFHENGRSAIECTSPRTFKRMGLDTKRYHNTTMLLAGYQFYQRTDRALDFVSEWLQWCTDWKAMIHDHSGMFRTSFVHCYDQSILTLLAEKHNVRRIVDPRTTGILTKNV